MDNAGHDQHQAQKRYDFIIVGSGAGGGPLAANLVEAGFSVLLLEAGTDHHCYYYDVPIMLARASEDPDMRWDFFVRHYTDDQAQQRDSKFVEARNGVLYPRGATLGGSTAISAMITVYPHNSDWDKIASLTGDASWNADAMRRYFERIEQWQGPDSDPSLKAMEGDHTRHGFSGWLKVQRAAPALAGREPYFLRIINAIEETSRSLLGTPEDVPLPNDPNDWRFVCGRGEGMSFIPVAVDNGVRNGTRERILAAQQVHPDRLAIRFNALVARVLFEGKRAIGVEYLDGAHLYRADPLTGEAPESASLCTAFAEREVILAGGAFNTPQLLKLSGIGPRSELDALGIPVVTDAPGVGENLQDRYEVAVINQLVEDYPLFDGATLDIPASGEDGDPLFQEWQREREGPYTTNGSLAAFVRRSSVAGKEPDLFVFALPTFFRGYYPGYAAEAATHHDKLTWVVLKAHTNNRAGRVLLKSTDPREPPRIEFRYFEEGSDHSNDDLEAVIDGIELARTMAGKLGDIILREEIPGDSLRTRDALREFVRSEAWGHHASCTCRIGPDDDPEAVLDSDFRVRGVQNLRVVDASVFPFIPGFFIASAVYIVSEKASEVIVREHAKQAQP